MLNAQLGAEMDVETGETMSMMILNDLRSWSVVFNAKFCSTTALR